MENLIKKNIQRFAPYVVDKEPVNIILNANESPYNLFYSFKDEFVKRLEEIDFNRYPDTDSDDLRKALAKYLNIEKGNLICGNGSDEIIQIIINTFVDKEDAVIVPTPTFSMYGNFTSIVGGKVIEVPAKKDFQMDIEEIIKQANKNTTKIIFLCNPNNPTGTGIPRESILRVINETSSIIVLDEAYGDFCRESNVDLTKDPRVIVLRTFSKAFSLAGARLGYAVAHKDTMNILYRVKSPYNLNVFSQLIGEIILDNIQLIEKNIDIIVKERDRVMKELQSLEGVNVYPSSANFILFKSQRTQNILEQCKRKGIAIRSYKDAILKDHIRLSIGTFQENQEILNIIKGVYKNEKSKTQ